jgi:hypothetical protein
MSPHTLSRPTPEQIACAAYAIWENEGRPHGRDLAHWLQAEEQLKAELLREAEPARSPEPAGQKEARATVRPRAPRRKRPKHKAGHGR